MAASEEQALMPGTVVDSFEIESILGVGGFGITYRARDCSLERTVALKEYFPSDLAARRDGDTTLEPRTLRDRDSYSYGLKRFLDEARTLALFQDRNIVRVNTFVEANGTAYLVMDYEEGRTLSDVLRQYGRLGRKQALAITVHILRGLRVVHAKRILHRDIKPANVFVRRSGPPLLLDFGAARQALERQAGDVTVMLTPGYAPIEQYGGDDRLGPWSDLYALGATVSHLVTGYAPLAATQRVTVVQDSEPDPVIAGIYEHAEELGPTLTRALAWMLEMHPKARPQTADEVLELLMPGRVDTASSITTGGLTGTAQTAAGVPTNLGGPPPLPTQPPAVEQVDPVHSTEVLDAVEKSLSEYLGPIARVLIERASKTARGTDALYESLAQELEDEGERREFLATKPRGR